MPNAWDLIQTLPVWPLHLFLLTTLVWITYGYALKAGFVSDDLQGIVSFDGKLQGMEYGMISRWLRYHLAGGNFPSTKKAKTPDGKEHVVPQGKIPLRHHLNILLVFNAAVLLTYSFLEPLFGAKFALFSVALFIVHPVGVQAVAWCSAMGYPLSLFWIGALLNLARWFYSGEHPFWAWILGLIAFSLFQFMGIHAQFIPMMSCVILWFLGYREFAVIAALISAVMVFDIIKQTVDLRKSEFQKQKMGDSIFLSPRKAVVAVKTFLYYLGLTLVPRKMGLYHKWGFHYSKDLERADKLFWIGLVGLLGLVGIFFLAPFPVQFGILWFVAFSIIFWNWITIQQFITERYIFVPTLGTCILITYFTQNFLWIYTLIFGLYLCRTWMHLPTYDNELRFYQSNHWNFPDSEVALGNLGVTYVNLGMEGSAMDHWHMATSIEPGYDVPWYNIFSVFKARALMAIQNGDYTGGIAQLNAAYPYLEKVLNSKVCHFPEMWEKERTSLLEALKNPFLMLVGEMNRLENLLAALKARLVAPKDEKDKEGIEISVRDTTRQIERLKDFFERNNVHIVLEHPNDILSKLTKGENK